MLIPVVCVFAILGLILGPITETGFAQAMIMGRGSYAIFFNRPQAIALWLVIILLLVPPVVQIVKQHRSGKIAAVGGEE